jgi:hypothetical protein
MLKSGLSVAAACVVCVPAMGQVSLAWLQRYSGPLGNTDGATGAGLDAAGHLYVTGTSGTGISADIATVKYDSKGNELWARRYEGMGGTDQGWALALGDDAVFVTGDSAGNSTDIVTIRYDADGTQRWLDRYDGPAAANDFPAAIACDPAGNVYVAGTSVGIGTQSDIVLLKYDRLGERLWVRRFDAGANSLDGARALAIDSAGNICITGRGTWTAGRDVTTLKYSPEGDLLWAAAYAHPGANVEDGRALAIDSADNIIVTGTSGATGQQDIVTIKYSPQGQELWSRRFAGSRTPRDDAGHSVAVASSGVIYIAGQSSDPKSSAATLLVYSAEGDLLWHDRRDMGTHAAADHVVLDAQGAAYVATRFVPVHPFDPLDIQILKYHGGAEPVWTFTYGGPLSYVDIIRRLAISPQGRVYAVGSVDHGPIGEVGDYLVLALDQGQSCYANCDGSTQEPILNVADFSCFLSKFAAGDPYANCDGSTQEPVLNVADFSCFLQKFAAACL